jgi:hypothetical protein
MENNIVTIRTKQLFLFVCKKAKKCVVINLFVDGMLVYTEDWLSVSCTQGDHPTARYKQTYCIFIKGTVQQEKNCLKVVLFDRPYVALDHCDLNPF